MKYEITRRGDTLIYDTTTNEYGRWERFLTHCANALKPTPEERRIKAIKALLGETDSKATNHKD